jgi:hypothetical protein
MSQVYDFIPEDFVITSKDIKWAETSKRALKQRGNEWVS